MVQITRPTQDGSLLPASETILVVDDDPESRRSVQLILQAEGYEVAAAGDGQQALAWLEHHACPLIVTALMLPNYDGLDFFRTLKANWPSIEVILITTADAVERAVEGLRHGASACLVRPVEPVDLIGYVRRALEVQGLRRQREELKRALQEQNEALIQTRRREAELEALRQVSQSISRTITLEDALQAIRYHARALCEADYCQVILCPLEEVEPQAEPEALFALNLARRAVEERRAVYQSFQHSAAVSAPLATWLALPLVSGDKVLGVLCLGHHRADALGSTVRQLLTIFADHAGIVLDNAHLFETMSSAFVDLAQSREEILHNRNVLQALFDGITDGLYILDKNLTVLAVNRAEAARIGQAIERIEGKTCAELGWVEIAPDLLDLLLGLFVSGRSAQWTPPEDADKNLFTDRELHLYPVQNGHPNVERFIVLVQDVSERKKLQATLFQTANLAALGQLATSVAHEINNPLTVAVANSQLLLMDLAQGSDQRESVQAIYEAGNRIKHIVDNLVEFSNQETYVFGQVDLVKTIESALALTVSPLKNANIAVVKRFDARPQLVASSSHLKMIWMNMFLNACDAIVESKRSGRIQIHVAHPDEATSTVTVSIRDNGTGTATDDYQQLFRPFYTTKPVGEALGMGLFTSNAIVERHQGQIKVESQKGRGSVFRVTLPLDLNPGP